MFVCFISYCQGHTFFIIPQHFQQELTCISKGSGGEMVQSRFSYHSLYCHELIISTSYSQKKSRMDEFKSSVSVCTPSALLQPPQSNVFYETFCWPSVSSSLLHEKISFCSLSIHFLDVALNVRC